MAKRKPHREQRKANREKKRHHLKYITIPTRHTIDIEDPLTQKVVDHCTWPQFIAMVFSDQKLLEKRNVFARADLRKKLMDGMPSEVVEIHEDDYPALLAAVERPSTVTLGFAYQAMDWFQAIRDAGSTKP